MKRILFIILALFNICQAQTELKMKKVGNRYYDHLNKYTGEYQSFAVVEEWADGTAMDDNKVDGTIYRKINSDYVLDSSTGKIDIKRFGVKGDGITDDRVGFQKAIDACASTGRTLVVSQGKYLLNSYSEAIPISTHFGILELKSNLHIEIDSLAEIIVGNFFDDKAFILLSGFNAVNTAEFTELFDISLSGKGKFSFSGTSSQMRTGYKRRIIAEFGKCTGVKVFGLTFENGDLSNGLCFGFGVYGNQVQVFENTFKDLVQSVETINHDHTTVYCNADYATIRNNIFIGNDKVALVGCCTELHGSNSNFINNKFENYTRANYIAAVTVEKGDIDQIEVLNNSGTLTNSMVYFWPDNQKISNVLIAGNNIKHSHIDGYSALYNGVQGIAVFLEKTGPCENITIKGNTCKIINNVALPETTKTACYVACNVTELEISGNTFVGHNRGFAFKRENEALAKHTMLFVSIKNNRFDISQKLFYADVASVNYLSITGNETILAGDNVVDLIEIGSDGGLLNSHITDNIYRGFRPLKEFTPSASFLASTTNYAKYIVGAQILPIGITATRAFSEPVMAIPAAHIRPNALYTFYPVYTPAELMISSSAFANSASTLPFSVFNKSGAQFDGLELPGYVVVELK